MTRAAFMAAVLLLGVMAGSAQNRRDPDVPVLKRRPPANTQSTAPDQQTTDQQTQQAPAQSAPASTPQQQPEPQAPSTPPQSEPSVPAGSPDTESQPAMAHHHADMMHHGAEAMGFDQESTTHHFQLTRSGGLIRVTVNDPDDTETAGQISVHLRTAASQFARGDFSAPEHTHGQMPPGVAVMRELRSKITYTAHAIQDGAEMIISSQDAKAIQAIHQFLQFQIQDHQTGDSASVR